MYVGKEINLPGGEVAIKGKTRPRSLVRSFVGFVILQTASILKNTKVFLVLLALRVCVFDSMDKCN